MAWHEGKPEYRSSPNSKEVRENFAYLKALADLLSGAGVTEEELSQLHGSGVVKADLVKLHALTSTHTEINQLHGSGVVKADLVKLHDITVPATQINTIGKIKARAYRKAAQNINAFPSTGTKILIDTRYFDTKNAIDTANSRIRPDLPGYYVVMGNVMAVDAPNGKRVTAMIYKNGVLVSHGTTDYKSAAGLSSSSASDLIYMNGTTDYLELYAFNSYSYALALYTGHSYQNYISIVGPF